MDDFEDEDEEDEDLSTVREKRAWFPRIPPIRIPKPKPINLRCPTICILMPYCFGPDLFFTITSENHVPLKRCIPYFNTCKNCIRRG